jgi:hypothetical protein
LTVADSVVVPPAPTDVDCGDTVTVVTTGGGGGEEVTVIAAVPVFPELVAVMVADPAAFAVTTPSDATLAALELLVDQVTVCPEMTFPD